MFRLSTLRLRFILQFLKWKRLHKWDKNYHTRSSVGGKSLWAGRISSAFEGFVCFRSAVECQGAVKSSSRNADDHPAGKEFHQSTVRQSNHSNSGTWNSRKAANTPANVNAREGSTIRWRLNNNSVCGMQLYRESHGSPKEQWSLNHTSKF